jgi:tape measure domain-containing protein
MAKDVRFLISANVDRAEQEIRKLQSSGKAVSDSLAGAFESLGIRSTVAIEKERAASIAAYERIKASGVASAAEIGRAKAALTTTTERLNKENLNLDRSMKTVKQSSDGLGSSIGALAGGAILAAVAATGMYVKSCIAAGLEQEKLNTVFKVSAGSSQLAARELQFIREESNRLGLNMMSTADSYGKFLTSIKGTATEGEIGRKIFVGISEGMTALKKNADESNRVFAQVQQSMSKGKIELEDMKVIAEAGIPIFQILADAMGKSRPEIMKMMSDGKLLSNEVWPLVAEAMHKAFGRDAQEAAKGAQGEINRFTNSVQASKVVLGDVFLPVLTSVLNTFNSSADVLKPFVGTMQNIGVATFSVVEKFTALKDAGGLIGLITGGSEARQELAAQFKAIDELKDWNKDKINNRLNPNVSSAKTTQELAAENARIAEVAAKSADEKAMQAAEKLSSEKKSFEEQVYKNELQRFQDNSKLKLQLLEDQHAAGLVSNKDYYLAVVSEEQKSFELQKNNALNHINDLQKLRGTPGYGDAEKALKLEKDILAAIGAKDHMEVEFQLKRNQATLTAVKSEKAYADTVMGYIKEKQKEIAALQTSFIDSNKIFEDSKNKILGTSATTSTDPVQKAQALRDQLLASEKAYDNITDPKVKQDKLKELSDQWGKLTEQIDFSTMLQSQKMIELSKIEDERNRIQTAVLQNANNEKAALEGAYDTAISKVHEYKNELQLLADVIQNIPKDVTVNLKVNGAADVRSAVMGIGNSGAAGVVNSAAAGSSAAAAGQLSAANGVANSLYSYASFGPADNGKAGNQDVYGSRSTGSYGGYSPYSGNRTEVYGGYNNNGSGQAGAVVNGNFYDGGYLVGQKLPGSWRSTGAGSYSDANGNSFSSYAVGTNRVPRDGLAYLHKDEAVVPKQYNPAVGGQGSGLTIEGDINFSFPNVTDKTSISEIARQIMPELRALQSRYR